MQIFKEDESCSLPLAPGNFIYKIARISNNKKREYSFAVISSNDSIHLVHLDSKGSCLRQDAIENAHQGISCVLEATQLNLPADGDGNVKDGELLLSAGRDGAIRGWDLSAKAKHIEMQTPNGQGVSALAHSPFSNLVAAGTELELQGTGDVAVYIWNMYSPEAPIRSYLDSYNDTMTNLTFLPPRPSRNVQQAGLLDPLRLVVTSMDGLVTLFDTTRSEEEDAVVAVLNNRSAVHHVAIVPSDVPDPLGVLTVSHDERLAYLTFSENEDAQLEEGRRSDGAAGGWDFRQDLGVDYSVCLRGMSKDSDARAVLCVGANKEETSQKPHITLCKVVHPPYVSNDPNEETLAKKVIRLEGAHGEEVVRDIWWDEDASLPFVPSFHPDSAHSDEAYIPQCPYIITGGEDGYLRVWHDSQKEGVSPWYYFSRADADAEGDAMDITAGEGSGQRPSKKRKL